MGLDVGLIVSDDRHYDPFLCAICQSMVDLDALVTTATNCSHCFCRTCLPFWLERSTTCPTCNRDLVNNNNNNNSNNSVIPNNNYYYNNNNNNNNIKCPTMMIGKRNVMVQPLEICQPLAHRLLKRVLVECPLNLHGKGIITCGWKGDYGDLETHLLSSTAHPVTAAAAATDADADADADADIAETETTGTEMTTSNNDNNNNNLVVDNNNNNNNETSPCNSSDPSIATTTTTMTTTTMTDDEIEAQRLQQEQQKQKLLQQQKLRKQQERIQKQSLAASLKEEANGKFESHHFKEANLLYTKAIQVLQDDIDNDNQNGNKNNNENTNGSNNNNNDNNDSDNDLNSTSRSLLATLYSNRAASLLQLQEYSACLEDCQYILMQLKCLDNTKVYIRISRAAIQLGKLDEAEKYLELGLKQPDSSIPPKQKTLLKRALANVQKTLMILQTQGWTHLENQRYAEAKSAFSTLLKEAPSAIPFLLGASQADLGLGLMDSALRLTKGVLMQHAQNPTAYWIRGQAVFSMGDDMALGLKLLLEALRLDPDSQKIKNSYKNSKKVHGWMQQAEQHVFRRQFREAISFYTQCMDAMTEQPLSLPPKAPLYATLYTKRAEAYLRLKEYSNALKDCAKVLYGHDEDYIPACLVQIKAFHGLEQHESALSLVQQLLQKFPHDVQLQQAHERADFLLRKSRRVDYYKLLGVSSIATEVEIKKAYKRKALEWHPDKHSTKSPQEQAEAQKQFQLLGEGLELLCNEFTRRLYDEGYDLEQIRERVEAAKQAAHNPWYNHHHRGSPYW